MSDDHSFPILTVPARPTSPSGKSDASGVSDHGSTTSSYVSGVASLGSSTSKLRKQLGMVPEEEDEELDCHGQEPAFEKPRQRVLSSNRIWLIAVATFYTVSFYLDLVILSDATNYGPSEPVWWQTTFPIYYETAEVPTYGKGDEIIDLTPIPKLPAWRNIMEAEILYTCENLHEDDYNLTLIYLQEAIVPMFAGVIDVQQTGIVQVEIRFFKPYWWGAPSARQSLDMLLEKGANPGARMYSRTPNPRADERGQPSNFDTFNMNLGSPLRGYTSITGVPLPLLTHGEADGRPPTWSWTNASAYSQMIGVISASLASLTISNFAWDVQVQDYGDVRLSVKQDDPRAKEYRMKWPAYILIFVALLRLEVLPELSESLKSQKEHWSLIALMVVGCTFQIFPQSILQLHLIYGSGAGISFGLFLSMGAKIVAFIGTMVLWERSNAFTATGIALKLSWDAHTSLTWQRVAAMRFAEFFARCLPIAVLMSVYDEWAALWVLGIDSALIFFAMVWTAVRQQCLIGDEPCHPCNFFYFYLSRLPLLLFAYNDGYTGRSYDNSTMHPLLYLCFRSLSFGTQIYLWWYAQTTMYGPGGGIPSVSDTTANLTKYSAREWINENGTTPFLHSVSEDPINGFGGMMASGIFFLAYIIVFIDVWKRSGAYYGISPARRRGLCFCWNCVKDAARRRCGLCGGVDAIPAPPPKSKFRKMDMSATAFDKSRESGSLMLQRLRSRAAESPELNHERIARLSKYRVREDTESNLASYDSGSEIVSVITTNEDNPKESFGSGSEATTESDSEEVVV